eukprot:6179227-Pleurochrysis_carterae.AAC.1
MERKDGQRALAKYEDGPRARVPDQMANAAACVADDLREGGAGEQHAQPELHAEGDADGGPVDVSPARGSCRAARDHQGHEGDRQARGNRAHTEHSEHERMHEQQSHGGNTARASRHAWLQCLQPPGMQSPTLQADLQTTGV